MPSNKNKRRNDRKCKVKADLVEQSGDNTSKSAVICEEEVSSSVGADLAADDLGTENVDFNISGEHLLCLDELYSDTQTDSALSSNISLAELEDWTPSISPVSLVVGEGTLAASLRDLIVQQTIAHDVTLCKLEDSFELCSNQCFVLIWILMDMPVAQEILSLTTSIRYASNCNRGTVIIGAANIQSNVDLRLHGVDEIVLQPVSVQDIRQKYTKWTTMQIVQETVDLPESEEPELSVATTSSMPAAPSLQCDNAENPVVSNSVDSGIDSPSTPPSASACRIQLPSFSQLKAMVPRLKQEAFQKSLNAMDHTTKEKVRRERIKDSCDQLRVLLPYVRGRKTDMASILEMCVEYLKVVTAALPLDFQNQIAEILTSGDIPSGGRSGRKTEKATPKQPPSPENSNTVSSSSNDTGVHTDTVENGEENVRVPNVANKNDVNSTDNRGFKRDLSDGMNEVKAIKRVRIHSGDIDGVSAVQHLPVLPTVDAIQIPSVDHVGYPSYQAYHPLPSQVVYSDYESSCRIYGNHDSYMTTQYYDPIVHGNHPSNDMDHYEMYKNTQSLYHFYGNGHFVNGYNMNGLSDYVNPNAVLPMRSNNTIKQEGYEEQTSVVMTTTVD